MIVRPGVAADLRLATAWLTDARLPGADLTPEHMKGFLFAVVDDEPVGMIGLEQYGDTGLLRSLVVDAAARNDGIGRHLVGALEDLAASRKVKELWLLTIDADQYFGALGYTPVNRADAPEVIRDTVEFSRLCPGDAVLMRKRF